MFPYTAGTSESAELKTGENITTKEEILVPQDVVKVPQSIHDVDNGAILGFGADLDADHPVSATNIMVNPYSL